MQSLCVNPDPKTKGSAMRTLKKHIKPTQSDSCCEYTKFLVETRVPCKVGYHPKMFGGPSPHISTFKNCFANVQLQLSWGDYVRHDCPLNTVRCTTRSTLIFPLNVLEVAPNISREERISTRQSSTRTHSRRGSLGPYPFFHRAGYQPQTVNT